MSAADLEAGWVLRLPDRWDALPADAEAIAEHLRILPEALAADPAADARGVLGLFRALAQDVAAGGVALLAWTTVEVRAAAASDVPPEGGSQPRGHQVIATSTLRLLEADPGDGAPRGWASTVIAPSTIHLPGGEARFRVDLVTEGEATLLQSRHLLRPATTQPVELTGRTPDLGLAEELVRLFAAMAASFEVLD